MTFIELIKLIDSFFFNYSVSTEFLGLFRIAVCSLVIVDFIALRKDILTHILPNKLFPYEDYLKIKDSEKYANMSVFAFKIFGNSELFSHIMIYLFYVFGFASLLGIYTNFSLIILLVVYASIQSRAIPVWSTAGDLIIKLMILCLALTECGQKLSIDYIFRGFTADQFSEGWPIRIIQIYLCSIYLAASIGKSHDLLWQQGNAVKYSSLNPCWGQRSNYVHRLMDSKLSKILNYCIMYMQFFAPLFLWLKDTRVFYAISLMFFHLGILLFLKIGYFGPMFIIALFTFLDVLYKY